MTNSRHHTQNGVELSQGISMVLDLSTNDTVGLEYGDVQSDVKVGKCCIQRIHDRVEEHMSNARKLADNLPTYGSLGTGTL